MACWSRSCTPSPSCYTVYIRDRLSRYSEHRWWLISMTLITLISLYIDDIQQYYFTKSSDTIFQVISTYIFIIYLVELILLCLVQAHYPLSLFFFLDLISTLAIFPHTSFMPQALLGDAFRSNSSTTTNFNLMRAARATRAGTRASRILRISRIIRILRLAKLSKIVVQRLHKKSSPTFNTKSRYPHHNTDIVHSIATPSHTSSSHTGPPLHPQYGGDQSRVGARLADLTAQRLAVMVLSMLFIIPLISYHDDIQAPLVALDQIIQLSRNQSVSLQHAALQFTEFQDRHGVQSWTVLALRLQSPDAQQYYYESEDLQLYRSNEISVYQYDDQNEVVFSIQAFMQNRSLYSIYQTTFIIMLMGIAALVFLHDAEHLIIHPIERMTRVIDRLRSNPLAKNQHRSGTESEPETLETAMLEHTLEKLTGLLQIGFGEAGSAMIQKNINANGELNALVNGERVLAIFGFCHIRGFQDMNGQLHENIMLFVNEIAEIVHRQVHESGGAVNRNLGETFVLVWKIPQIVRADRMEWILEHDPQGIHPDTQLSSIEHQALQDAQQTAAHALAAFIRVIYHCSNPSPQLQQLLNTSNNVDLCIQQSTTEGVSVGLGLHVGWAIEGAIGSRFKIDASYLSPNVNMAARLMAATKQYRVPLLFSKEFWSILPLSARNRCRQLDRVAVKGSNKPIGLYTFDLNTSLPSRSSRSSSKSSMALISMTKSAIERRRREHRNKAKTRPVDFDNDKLLNSLQNGVIVKAFRENHEEGLAAYLQGDWAKAIKLFEMALRFKPSDGPTDNLIKYIRDSGGHAPEYWSGYRPLSQK